MATVKLKHIDTLKAVIKKRKKILDTAGEQVIYLLTTKYWPKKMHANGHPVLGLRDTKVTIAGVTFYYDGYKRYKKSVGAKPYRDFKLSGRMWNDLHVRVRKFSAIVGFKSRKEQLKAVGNFNNDDNFMKVGPPITNDINRFVKKYIKDEVGL